jgi:hypothetical protein
MNFLKKKNWDGTDTFRWLTGPEKPEVWTQEDLDLLDSEPTPRAFQGFEIGTEELCGTFNGTRPTMAVAENGNVYIAIDKGSSNIIVTFSKVNGNWRETTFAQGSRGGQYDASRLYMPHLEIGSDGRAWLSCKFGCAEYGKMLGQGLWLIENMNAFSPKWFRWVKASDTHKGNGNVATDPADPRHAYMICSEGKWAYYNDAGNIVSKGSINLGKSGEKVRGLISPNKNGTTGLLHAAMGGYSGQSSSYQNKGRGGASPVVYAAYSSYPESGSDMAHPAGGIDLTAMNVFYISVPYDGVSINVWRNGKLMFPPNGLRIIDQHGNMGPGVDRFAAQWSPRIGGGSFLTWVNSGRIKIAFVNKKGGVSSAADICAGSSPTMFTTKDGVVHLAYVHGGMRYRKLTPK